MKPASSAFARSATTVVPRADESFCYEATSNGRSGRHRPISLQEIAQSVSEAADRQGLKKLSNARLSFCRGAWGVIAQLRPELSIARDTYLRLTGSIS